MVKNTFLRNNFVCSSLFPVCRDPNRSIYFFIMLIDRCDYVVFRTYVVLCSVCVCVCVYSWRWNKMSDFRFLNYPKTHLTHWAVILSNIQFVSLNFRSHPPPLLRKIINDRSWRFVFNFSHFFSSFQLLKKKSWRFLVPTKRDACNKLPKSNYYL